MSYCCLRFGGTPSPTQVFTASRAMLFLFLPLIFYFYAFTFDLMWRLSGGCSFTLAACFDRFPCICIPYLTLLNWRRVVTSLIGYSYSKSWRRGPTACCSKRHCFSSDSHMFSTNLHANNQYFYPHTHGPSPSRRMQLPLHCTTA